MLGVCIQAPAQGSLGVIWESLHWQVSAAPSSQIFLYFCIPVLCVSVCNAHTAWATAADRWVCFVPFRQCEKGHPPPASSALPAWKPPPSPGSAGTAPSSHLRDHNPRPHSCRDSSFLLGRELTPGAVQAGIGSASDCILAACKG